MNLNLKNIGILTSSQIEIAGISVIAGPNSTGKSTFGKALYAIFNALYQFDQRLLDSKFRLVHSVMASLLINHVGTEDLFHTTRDFINKLKEKEISKDRILSVFKDFTKELELSAEDADSAVQKISRILLLDDRVIQNNVILGSLRSEFGPEIQNLFHLKDDAEIRLTIANKTTTINISENKVTSVQGVQKLDIQPIYLDERVMLLLDNRSPIWSHFVRDHASDLVRLVQGNEITSGDDERSVGQIIQSMLRTELIRPVFDKLEEICHGRLVKEKEGLLFADGNDPRVRFSIANLSAGLKVFLVLQELVMNGALKEKGTVILDEPEIHLHPEWQVVFAELLVVLQKALGLHILLTTHSPYFVSALEVYSRKYAVTSSTKFYFAKSNESNTVIVSDVSNNLTEIYDSLAKPYQTIEDVEIKYATS